MGFCDWVRVPVDLMNALAVFQIFMDQSFKDYGDHSVALYFDDPFIFSSDFSSDIKHFQLTLKGCENRAWRSKQKNVSCSEGSCGS